MPLTPDGPEKALKGPSAHRFLPEDGPSRVQKSEGGILHLQATQMEEQRPREASPGPSLVVVASVTPV